ncbi:hypothetical protein PCL_00056 [Purpureocillium lilacinum]|uniref:Transmembrane protein n=1 Tax=Purpureocillium lilacinum TaxID=33203 RepID=A0A2U3E5X1_PURLI|nr:hypothetical protein Purlil1_5746 [Purpureocillium lilacinum]PWI69912.1 hypothetical protein PCL_00056 [Purpureocillium lilacinum]
MNRILRSGAWRSARRLAAPSIIGGATILYTGPSVRFDTPAVRQPRQQRRSLDTTISPDMVRQVSSGSLAGTYLPLPQARPPSLLLAMPKLAGPRRILSSPASPSREAKRSWLIGFAAGVVVALFSRTLVFLGGLLVLSIHVRTCVGGEPYPFPLAQTPPPLASLFFTG